MSFSSHLGSLDWAIIIGVFVLTLLSGLVAIKYTRSVADFLAANRCAKRYVLTISEGAAGLGAITLIGMWQLHYESGFTGMWWSIIMCTPVGMIIAVTGFVMYRYRQTRALTMAQFFEMRYSRNFRVFAGILAFACGVVNFGLFPAVATNFFMACCGIPEVLAIGGIMIKTYPLVMATLIATPLLLICIGGQIAIMITDFFQGVLTSIIFLALLIVVFHFLDWQQVGAVASLAPKDQSIINPFKNAGFENFNLWYFLITLFGMFYCYMAWQGSQGYACSAKTPHEAKMGKILAGWRMIIQSITVLLLPILAYVLMKHPEYSTFASDARAALATISNEQVRSQMTVPVVFTGLLPIGLKGALAAAVLTAFISNANAYLHSWGSIFIQDVILPFRKHVLDVRTHLRLLRISIFGVAVFVFLFGLVFKQVEAIMLFFAMTGTIFLGGAGAVIIGGLYWKKGTTLAAWTAMIIGTVVAVTGFSLQQVWPTINDGTKFPINGQWIWAIGMAASFSLYIIISLVQNRLFNLDQMLHRGSYAIQDDVIIADEVSKESKRKSYGFILSRLGLSHEFTAFDKAIFWTTVGWGGLWLVVFILGTCGELAFGFSDQLWLEWWKIFSWSLFIIAISTTIWFTIGGFINLKHLFRDLALSRSDEKDDGTVASTLDKPKFDQQMQETKHQDKINI